MKIKVLIILLLFGAILSFIIIVHGTKDNLNNEEIIKLGEAKYLELLWMVKGAFEDKKITVNNRELEDSQKIFTCRLSEIENDCIGSNFEEAFHHLFSKNISYEKVYGDGISYSWIRKINQEYHFLYNVRCYDNVLEDNYQLIMKSYSDDEITYEITSLDFFKNFTRILVLVKEDNIWKISQAFYRDKCLMDYYIS